MAPFPSENRIMNQTAGTLVFEQAPPRAHERRSPASRAARDDVARDARASEVVAAGPDHRDAPVQPLTAAELDRRRQRAIYLYTGRMLWAACLFLAGGAVLASAERISTTVCSIALACLAGAVVVQYLGRRQLRAALVDCALAKGTPTEAATSEAEATLERILR